ncbi:ATP-dependent helicase HrpB [Synechococcus sp. CS-1329]|uniref:ATP-dependent helicase HrpB n=1 Tax=Synechococcus sp. CS-1329 TaxID=2847975 RepID=UPI00223B8D08|nr:ATP-dependent helicase HrpB [Synechococcus sp. CS-1329]MCT0219281.1 ATP-dependent helicase HrpB [Synechococcus sp. CS-1329]
MGFPCSRHGEALPIDPLLPEILQQLPPGGTLLLQAPPGAGKTSRVPLALLQHLGSAKGEGGTILMLEPRRLAAKAAATRLAEAIAEPVGALVGYRVRLEQRVSKATRLEVITDGLFLRRLQDDPALEGVAAVIFDEFHERRSDADLALALLREARPLLNPQLRLLVMSATLNLQPLSRQLPEAVVLSSEGRSHPVELHHQPPREREPLGAQVVRALEDHWLQEEDEGGAGTALVFLPGQREIRQALRAIEATGWGQRAELHSLHGGLSLEAQGRAIAAGRHPAGKVVLTTAIAESSLTIEGVRLVVDSGLSRRSRFDPRTGMDGLITLPASQASAEQRRGRAGRLGPGHCVRLWSPAEQQRRPAYDPPELLDADPLPLVLQLARWGAGLGESLPWLDPPPQAALRQGLELLKQLGAIDPHGVLSAHGRAMAQLGLHPRLAHMLLEGQCLGNPQLACELATLLNERDPLAGEGAGSDLMARLDWLRQDRRDPRRGPLRQLCRQLQQQLQATEWPAARSRGAGAEAEKQVEGEAELAAVLLSCAYPERIALARLEGQGRFLMRSGRGAQLPAHDPLAGQSILAVAAVDDSGSDGRILLALPLQRQSLERLQAQQGEQRPLVSWEPAERRVRAVVERRLGALVLERRPWDDPPPAALLAALLDGLRSLGLAALPWSRDSRDLQHRLNLAHARRGEPWPDRSETALEQELEQWLGDQLLGLRSQDDLRQLDLMEGLWSGLAWEHRQELERLLPSQITLPTGRRARLEYGSGEPVLAVKLQELFGLSEGPRVLEGDLPVSLHLLSPARRPVQITQDLCGFWRGSYAEVRRELRGRYPRHPWPEDPAQALPTAGTSRAQARVSQGTAETS